MSFAQKTKKLLDSIVSFLLQKRKTVLLVAAVIAATLLVSSLVSLLLSNIGHLYFPTVGTIRTSGLEAYWDTALTNETQEIPWGVLYPGSEPKATVYLRSIGNTPITLEMTTANWTFHNSFNEDVYGPANTTEYLSLSWNYNGSTVIPDQVIPIVFTLRVDNNLGFLEYVIEYDVQRFSFDINVQAIEQSAH